MNVTLWGTRGSLAAPGPETSRFGGNTSCVEIIGREGTVLVLDAGTGIRRLGAKLPRAVTRVDILLTHLHLDHIQGLGFFRPLDDPSFDVHIWGPASASCNLRTRLGRYLSPPLFPVHLRDMTSHITLHDLASSTFRIGEFDITSMFVCHPGLTLGFRITDGRSTVTYIPDHEPALGSRHFPGSGEWTSGFALAQDTDVLIHDAQFTEEEYGERAGWGHSSLRQAIEFAQAARAKQLVAFHHDPSHDDADLSRMAAEAHAEIEPGLKVVPAIEGSQFDVG